jgi:ABC-type nitrate/sulfonate/bicarbonate transport system substrate-binding protein
MSRSLLTRLGPLLVVVVAGVAITTACGTEPYDPNVRRIRVAYAGAPDFDDLASLVAHERLRADGYIVEFVPFALSELGAEALARGDVDFANGAIRSYWAARSRGAPIVTVMEHVVNVHRLVVDDEISTCRDLDDRRLGIQSEGAAGTALLRAYLDDACPSAEPDFLLVPRSENRTVALSSGGLDAAVLELSDVLWLEAQYPERFRILANFQARWPLVPATGVHVNEAFAAANPDTVYDYVRARLLANRAVNAEPSLLLPQAETALGLSAKWPLVADAYIANVAWNPRGGLTADGVARALAMLTRYGGLPEDLTAASVADLSFLSAALADLDPPGLSP